MNQKPLGPPRAFPSVYTRELYEKYLDKYQQTDGPDMTIAVNAERVVLVGWVDGWPATMESFWVDAQGNEYSLECMTSHCWDLKPGAKDHSEGEGSAEYCSEVERLISELRMNDKYERVICPECFGVGTKQVPFVHYGCHFTEICKTCDYKGYIVLEKK